LFVVEPDGERGMIFWSTLDRNPRSWSFVGRIVFVQYNVVVETPTTTAWDTHMKWRLLIEGTRMMSWRFA